jgi:hypothetical protein
MYDSRVIFCVARVSRMNNRKATPLNSTVKYKRNDRHSATSAELRLIRVGHVLWAMYKRSCGKSGYVSERQALWAALQQVWDCKRKLREEVKAERAAKGDLLRERFRPSQSATAMQLAL